MKSPRAAPGQAARDTAGRGAETPTDIPPRGWWAIAKEVGSRFSRHRIMEEAASVTFYTLLAIFPAIASVLTLYALFADPSTVERQLTALSGVVPGGGMQIIGEQVHAISHSGPKALGFGLLVSLVTSLWSSAQGVKSVFDALNVVYGAQDRRSFLRFTATALAITIGGLLMVLLVLAGVVAVPLVLGVVGLSGITDTLLSVLRWPVLLVVFALFLACLYRYGPDRPHPGWRWISPGSALATLVWAAASIGFSWYVSHFGSFNRTYGSLGAGVGMMTWIWISSIVVLMGAELDASMEQQAGHDVGDSGQETA